MILLTYSITYLLTHSLTHSLTQNNGQVGAPPYSTWEDMCYAAFVQVCALLSDILVMTWSLTSVSTLSPSVVIIIHTSRCCISVYIAARHFRLGMQTEINRQRIGIDFRYAKRRRRLSCASRRLTKIVTREVHHYSQPTGSINMFT